MKTCLERKGFRRERVRVIITECPYGGKNKDQAQVCLRMQWEGHRKYMPETTNYCNADLFAGVSVLLLLRVIQQNVHPHQSKEYHCLLKQEAWVCSCQRRNNFRCTKDFLPIAVDSASATSVAFAPSAASVESLPQDLRKQVRFLSALGCVWSMAMNLWMIIIMIIVLAVNDQFGCCHCSCCCSCCCCGGDGGGGGCGCGCGCCCCCCCCCCGGGGPGCGCGCGCGCGWPFTLTSTAGQGRRSENRCGPCCGSLIQPDFRGASVAVATQ